MLQRLREIDIEMSKLPEQLTPLAEQVDRAKEVLKQAEEANPARQTLQQLLEQADRADVENLGWCAGQQSVDPAVVAAQVTKLMYAAAGKPAAPAPAQASANGPEASTGGVSYEAGLALFVKSESALPASSLEALVLRKLFSEPWLAMDPKLRGRVMGELKREAKESSKWLPDPRPQILDDEGKALVSDGAGAFGSYFVAASMVALVLRQFRLQPPGAFTSSLNVTMTFLVEESIFKRLNKRLTEMANSTERSRAVLSVAYVHLIRASRSGNYEREHSKVVDALARAEVELQAGQKRIQRLRADRTEIVMQLAGIAGIVMTIIAIVGYLLYVLISGKPPAGR